MFAEQLANLVRRFWIWVLLSTLVCAGVGAGVLAAQPERFQVTATSTVVTNARVADPGTVQALASTVLMSMPAYVAQATSPSVVEAASKASGLSTEDVSGGLAVSREVDSTVLSWSLESHDPQAARAALTTAMQTFAQRVATQAARGADQKPLTVVQLTQPVGQASARGLSPMIGFAGGAALGALLAVVMAAVVDSIRTPVNDWDSVELATDVPVLAELGRQGGKRARQLGWVAEYLSDRSRAENVLTLGARATPSASDLEMLRRLLVERARHPVQVRVGELLTFDVAEQVTKADAVLVVIDRYRDDVREFGPEVRSLRRLCTGTVAIVLDSSRHVPARQARAHARADRQQEHVGA